MSSSEGSSKSASWKYILLAIGVFIIFLVLIMNCVFYAQFNKDDTNAFVGTCDCQNVTTVLLWANIFMTIVAGLIFIGLIVMIAAPNTYKQLSHAASTPVGQNPVGMNSLAGPCQQGMCPVQNNYSKQVSMVPEGQLSGYGIMSSQPMPGYQPPVMPSYQQPSYQQPPNTQSYPPRQ